MTTDDLEKARQLVKIYQRQTPLTAAHWAANVLVKALEETEAVLSDLREDSTAYQRGLEEGKNLERQEWTKCFIVGPEAAFSQLTAFDVLFRLVRWLVNKKQPH